MSIVRIFQKKDFFYLDDELQKFAFRSLLKELVRSSEEERKKFLSQLQKKDLLSPTATALFLSAETAREFFFLSSLFSSVSFDRFGAESILQRLEKSLLKDREEFSKFSRDRGFERLLFRLAESLSPEQTNSLTSIFIRALQIELLFGEDFEPSKRVAEAIISAAKKAQRELTIRLEEKLLEKSVEFFGHELDLAFFVLEKIRQIEKKEVFSIKVRRNFVSYLSKRTDPLKSLKKYFKVVVDAEEKAKEELGPFFQTVERSRRAKALVVLSYVLKLTRVQKEKIFFEDLSLAEAVKDISQARDHSLACSAWADEVRPFLKEKRPLDTFSRSVLLIRAKEEPSEELYQALSEDLKELVGNGIWTTNDVSRLIQSLPKERVRPLVERLSPDLRTNMLQRAAKKRKRLCL